MVRKLIIIPTLLFLNIFSGYSQAISADTIMSTVEQFAKDIIYQDQDTNYIKSYIDKLSVKLLVSNKFNYFQLTDKNLSNSIRFRPDLGVNFGIGIAYKWLAFDLSTNIGLQEKNIDNTRYRDFQLKAFSSKQYLRARYQYYSGYKIDNIHGFDLDLSDEDRKRQDIRTIMLGLQYLHVFNYGKFSLRAPFVQNELQRQSAGSLLAGGGFHLYNLDADSSLITKEMEPYFNDKLYYTQLNVVTLSVNLGYIYTFVLGEGFFITLSLIPGLGINSGDFRIEFREILKPQLTYRVKTMIAIGYTGRRIYTGIQVIGGNYPVTLDKKIKTYITEGRANFCLGYRF